MLARPSAKADTGCYALLYIIYEPELSSLLSRGCSDYISFLNRNMYSRNGANGEFKLLDLSFCNFLSFDWRMISNQCV